MRFNLLWRRFSLRVTLVTLITSLLLTAVALVSINSYVRSSTTAAAIADEVMAGVNEKVLIELDMLFTPVIALGNRITELPGLSAKPTLHSHPIMGYLLSTLLSYPYMYSAYLGFADDEFYQIISLGSNAEVARQTLSVPDTTRFVLRRIATRPDGKRIEMWRFLDAAKRTVGSRASRQVHYRPTGRPWYVQAKEVDTVVKTAPYAFMSNRALGITIARRFDGEVPGVFGADVTLSAVSEFLRKQRVGKSGKAFVFQENGDLLAHPDMENEFFAWQGRAVDVFSGPRISELNEPVLNAMYSQFVAQGKRVGKIEFEANGKQYIGQISPVPDIHIEKAHVGVYAPLKDFTGAIEAARNQNLAFTALVLVVALPLVLLIANRISSKLLVLSQDAKKIRDFELSEPLNLRSHIKEIDNLASTFDSMKSALKVFGQYVPQTLVQRIVQKELVPELGGQREELTLMFTDIEAFTSIAELLPPEVLMRQLSEYFHETSRLVIDHNGTIDKYIGDSIMAFWNAPSHDPEHTARACLAALRVAEITNALNAKWTNQGQSPFITRIGLHVGECVVGNVGSSERMDYTAIGDVVNLASRLESLNKYYGTQILVSEAVRNKAGDVFVFRAVGKVMPKGKSVPTEIFELVGLGSEVEKGFYSRWHYAYDTYLARDFELAEALFRNLAEERINDELVQLYHQRTLNYMTCPPDAGWCGVESFSAK